MRVLWWNQNGLSKTGVRIFNTRTRVYTCSLHGLNGSILLLNLQGPGTVLLARFKWWFRFTRTGSIAACQKTALLLFRGDPKQVLYMSYRPPSMLHFTLCMFGTRINSIHALTVPGQPHPAWMTSIPRVPVLLQSLPKWQFHPANSVIVQYVMTNNPRPTKQPYCSTTLSVTTAALTDWPKLVAAPSTLDETSTVSEGSLNLW